jgi:hypothetical protein
LGEAVREGETLGCLYSSSTPAAEVARDLPLLFEVADDAVAPALVHRHVV